ncbi:hypothetical protein D3C84_342500 [compost metagenome]
MLHGQAMQARGVAGAFLDGDDVLAVGHCGEEFIAHADPHAGGVVVQHDRQVGRAVDGQDVGRDLLLGRQGVGRRTDQDGVGLDGLRRLGIGDRLFGADGTRADHQGQAAIDHILGMGCEIKALLGGVSVVLAGGTADDDAVNLRFDQVFQHGSEGRLVDGPCCRQGSDCRGEDAVKVHFGFSCVVGICLIVMSSPVRATRLSGKRGRLLQVERAGFRGQGQRKEQADQRYDCGGIHGRCHAEAVQGHRHQVGSCRGANTRE